MCTAAQRFIYLALLCVYLATSVTADTTNRTLLGWKFRSNVEDYLSISTDACSIRTNVEKSPPDFATALVVYQKGLASPKILRVVAQKNYSSEQYGGRFSRYYNSTSYLDDYIMVAFLGNAPLSTDGPRRQAIRKSVQYAVTIAYMFHELDSALAQTKSGNRNVTSGAPQTVEKAFAIYAGENALCSPYGNAEAMSSDFATRHDCQYSKVNFQMLKQFATCRDAAASGDETAFMTAYAEIERLVVTQVSQSVIRYAYKLATDNTSARYEQQAASYTMWRLIAPYVNASTAKAQVAIIEELLQPANTNAPNTTYQQVAVALEAFFPTMGISSTDIGALGAAAQNVTCPLPPGSSASQSRPLLLLPVAITLLLALAAALL